MTLKIGELLKQDLSEIRRWFTWTPTENEEAAFELELAPVSRREFQRITRRHTKEVYNRALRSQIERTDNEASGNDIITLAVKNWRGLTVGKLNSLVLLKERPVDKNAFIDFSEENLRALTESLQELGAWIIETATRLKNFDVEEELKNS